MENIQRNQNPKIYGIIIKNYRNQILFNKDVFDTDTALFYNKFKADPNTKNEQIIISIYVECINTNAILNWINIDEFELTNIINNSLC